jgi:hypothetical protein
MRTGCESIRQIAGLALEVLLPEEDSGPDPN